jgi:hypothetical protein
MLFSNKMIFPESSFLNQKIPKERFYQNLEVDNKIKERFVNEIESIRLKNKFSKDTLGIKGTKNVEEVFIFSIIIKDESYFDKIEDLLLLIDRAIPYPILYEFDFKDKKTYKIAYKEKSKANANESVVDVYFTREIEDEKKFEKEIKGIFNSLNLEILYEKLIKIILQENSKKDVKELVENYKTKEILLKEIAVLEKKIKTEKQADRQFKLLNELGEKKRELEELG